MEGREKGRDVEKDPQDEWPIVLMELRRLGFEISTHKAHLWLKKTFKAVRTAYRGSFRDSNRNNGRSGSPGARGCDGHGVDGRELISFLLDVVISLDRLEGSRLTITGDNAKSGEQSRDAPLQRRKPCGDYGGDVHMSSVESVDDCDVSSERALRAQRGVGRGRRLPTCFSLDTLHSVTGEEPCCSRFRQHRYHFGRVQSLKRPQREGEPAQQRSEESRGVREARNRKKRQCAWDGSTSVLLCRLEFHLRDSRSLLARSARHKRRRQRRRRHRQSHTYSSLYALDGARGTHGGVRSSLTGPLSPDLLSHLLDVCVETRHQLVEGGVLEAETASFFFRLLSLSALWISVGVISRLGVCSRSGPASSLGPLSWLLPVVTFQIMAPTTATQQSVGIVASRSGYPWHPPA